MNVRGIQHNGRANDCVENRNCRAKKERKKERKRPGKGVPPTCPRRTMKKGPEVGGNGNGEQEGQDKTLETVCTSGE